MNTKNEISCREAVMLILKAEEQELAKPESTALEQHLQACSLCRHYQTQNQVINRLLHDHDSRNSMLSEEEKNAILQSIDQQKP